MPQEMPGYAYAAGFMLATALLHAAGVALGLLLGRIGVRVGPRPVQTGGGAIAFAGIAILIQAA
jgi:urease accessory protein